MSIDKKMEKTEKVLFKKEKQVEKAVAKEYQQALDFIRVQLSIAEQKYSKGGKLTYAEMSKYGRLQALEKQIADELNRINSAVNKNVARYQVDIWESSYYGTGFALETELQEKLSFALLPKDAVRQAVQNPLTQLALENNADQVKRAIRSTITRGLALGQSVPDISKQVKADLEKNANNATRIVRTETTRIQNEAIQTAGERAASKGIDLVKKWNATLDSRTRDRHRKLDQQTVELDEDFTVNGMSAPRPGAFGRADMDINCRCRLTYIPRGSTEPEYRRARGTDGKGKVIPYTNYNDWFKNRVSKVK